MIRKIKFDTSRARALLFLLLSLSLACGCAGDRAKMLGKGPLAAAHAHEIKGDFDKAIAELQKGIEEDPYSGRLYYTLGNLKLGLGDFEGARTAFWRASQLYEATGEHKTEAEPFNKLLATYDNLGMVLTLLGEYENAVWYHGRAELPPHDSYLPLRGKAFANLLKGDSEQALNQFNMYMSHFPSHESAMAPLLNLMEETAAGRVPKEAFVEYLKAVYSGYDAEAQKEHFDRAIKMTPGHAGWEKLKPQVQVNPGVQAADIEQDKEFAYVRTLITNQNLGEAEKRLKKLKKRYPDSPQVYQYIGVMLLNKGEPAKAEDSFLEGLKKDPHSLQINFNLATAYLTQGKFDKAKARALRVTARDPHYPDVNMLLSQLMVREKKYDEALSYAEKEAEINPKNPNVHANIGEIYYQHKKDYLRAIASYDRCLQLEPTDLEVRKWKSDAYAQLGDFDKAREEMLALRDTMMKYPQLREQVGQADGWIRELESKKQGAPGGQAATH